jgi:hypothetical protein
MRRIKASLWQILISEIPTIKGWWSESSPEFKPQNSNKKLRD